jgi:hypothetical protein
MKTNDGKVFPNPYLLEKRIRTLPPSSFHWDTTHAATSLADLEMRILEQLGVVQGANQGDGVEYPLEQPLVTQLDLADRPNFSVASPESIVVESPFRELPEMFRSSEDYYARPAKLPSL